MSQDRDGAQSPADLAPARALAELLPCGVVLIEAQGRLALASHRACEMLGVADAAALQARWDDIRPALCAEADGAQDPVELDIAGERRRLRVERQRVGAGSHQLVLLEDPAHDDSGRALWIAAGRAEAQQQVLAGIVHDLNGRLNNLNLTLTLLDTVLARHGPQAPLEPLLERCRRYSATLAAESKRITDVLHRVVTLIAPESSSDADVDMTALLDETRQALRHVTVLNEVALTPAEHDGPLWVRGDGALLRLALLDIVIGLMGATKPGGDIAMSAHPDGRDAVLRFAARGARITSAAAHAFDGIAVPAPPEALDLVAARTIIAAQGGRLTLRSNDEGAFIEARLARQPRT